MVESDAGADVDEGQVVVEGILADGREHPPGGDRAGDQQKPGESCEPEVAENAVVDRPQYESLEPRSEILAGSWAPMRPICVVAACAPHYTYVKYAAFRCSGTLPCLRHGGPKRSTWSPNLSTRPPTAAQPLSASGTGFRGSGPMYSDCGRMSRWLATCSSTWAVQPAARETAKVGGKNSLGRPIACSTPAE